MKSLTILLILLLLVITSCVKEDTKKCCKKDVTSQDIPGSKLKNDLNNLKNVELFFCITRVVKLSQKRDSTEVVDEITERIYLNSTGCCTNFKISFDITVLTPDSLIHKIKNIDIIIAPDMSNNLCSIINLNESYKAPYSKIVVTNLKIEKIDNSKAETLTYNPSLNIFKVLKIMN